ncbi:MAG: D-inositol-3-phosphate glycosyltransferase [Myxococcota bacterium]|nr:D-inositol-3-phosphate glycosyltransferase [Myxococcota bacterium]
MRVLMVIHDFPPRIMAGTEIYAWRLARQLMSLGHAVAVFCGEYDVFQPEGKAILDSFGGVPVFRHVHHRRRDGFVSCWENPAAGKALRQTAADFRPDILHVHHTLDIGLSGLRALQSEETPMIATLHDYFPLCPRGGQMMRAGGELCQKAISIICADCVPDQAAASAWVERQALRWTPRLAAIAPPSASQWVRAHRTDLAPLVDRLFMKSAGGKSRAAPIPPLPASAIETRLRAFREVYGRMRRVIAPSRFLYERMKDHGFDNGRLIILPHGHDASGFSPAPRGPGPVRFGFVGTPSFSKGLDVFCAAASQVTGAEFLVFGDTGVFPAFTRPLMERTGDRIQWRGPFDPMNAGAVYREFDALVIPSRWYENAPLTIAEARMARMPVIASRLGALPEAVRDGVDGLLFNPGDAGLLAACMRRLTENPALLRELAGNAPAVQPIEEHARTIGKLYRDALDG